jgi:hypothetical protein
MLKRRADSDVGAAKSAVAESENWHPDKKIAFTFSFNTLLHNVTFAQLSPQFLTATIQFNDDEHDSLLRWLRRYVINLFRNLFIENFGLRF